MCLDTHICNNAENYVEFVKCVDATTDIAFCLDSENHAERAINCLTRRAVNGIGWARV